MWSATAPWPSEYARWTQLTRRMAPVLSDPKLAKITYDSLEKAVEDGVKADAKREKAFAGSTA